MAPASWEQLDTVGTKPISLPVTSTRSSGRHDSIQLLVPGTWYHVPGTLYCTPLRYRRYQVPGTQTEGTVSTATGTGYCICRHTAAVRV